MKPIPPMEDSPPIPQPRFAAGPAILLGYMLIVFLLIVYLTSK